MPFSLVLTGLLLTSVQAFGQTPQLINFQAVARTTAGDPIPSTSVQVQFLIRKNDPTNGVIEYNSDVHNYSTDACGMFTAKIGEFNSNTFSQINWSDGTKYLEVKVGGLTIGTQQMVSVPYALQAGKVAPNSVGSSEIANGSIQAADLASGVIPAAYVPDIAIFEERKQNGITGGAALGSAFNTRILNTTVKASTSVSLDINSGFMTFANGTYIITASAPAVQADRHRLCLRTNNDVVVLRGTSELSNDSDASATRSQIQGVLTVPNDGTVFKLDHYFDSNNGGTAALGSPTGFVPGQEAYAQIMIQKIQ